MYVPIEYNFDLLRRRRHRRGRNMTDTAAAPGCQQSSETHTSMLGMSEPNNKPYVKNKTRPTKQLTLGSVIIPARRSLQNPVHKTTWTAGDSSASRVCSKKSMIRLALKFIFWFRSY